MGNPTATVSHVGIYLARQRRAADFQADPTDPRHGSSNGYRTLGCRCDRCRAGVLRVDRAFLTDPTDDRHGTLGGYTNLRCRCPRCRAAMYRYQTGNRPGRPRPLLRHRETTVRPVIAFPDPPWERPRLDDAARARIRTEASQAL